MADTQPISAKIIAVSQKGDGFKVEGYDNWFNLTNDYQGIPIPPVDSEIEFKYKPWMNPKSHKTAYYVDEIIPVTQVAPPQSVAGPHVPGNMAPASVASTPAPTSAPPAQAPRNGPEPLTADAGPVLGTHAYTSLSIERQVALKAAIEVLVGVYGGGAAERREEGELSQLALNVMGIASQLYDYFLSNSEGRVADMAMPDDTLVPTPSEDRRPWNG